MARRRYDDQFRAAAVVMLEAAGYPGKEGALTQVAKTMGVPAMTLHRWARVKNNPAPTQLVNEKRIDLLELINTELAGIFGTMPGARNDASYRDLATAAGILVDKRQLLTGQPTENVKAQTTVEYVNDWRQTPESTD